MKEIVLKVEGMTCGHCKKAVESALNKLDGIKISEADPAGGTVRVSFNPEKVDTSQMKDAIEEQGYEIIG